MVDALGLRGDEGRDQLRKAAGSRWKASIRRCPNGETHSIESMANVLNWNI